MTAQDILLDLIKIDSRYAKSNKEIIDYIKQKLSAFDISESNFKKDDITLYNLVVKISGKTKLKPLVFVCHTDTVNPSNGWTHDPFEPSIANGNIYGLGAADIKGSIAALLFAVTNLKKQLPRDIYLIFDCDEEGSGLGGKEITKKISLNDSEIIICEPTDNKIIVGQKACIGLDIITTGISLHSSRTSWKNNSENNAIYKAVKIINRLMIEEEKFNKIQDPLYGSPTINIGKIEGGTNGNSVADKCLIKVDIRLLPSQNMNEVLNMIKLAIKQEDLNSSVLLKFFGESFHTDKNSEFIKKLKKESADLFKLDTSISFGWNEAAIFNKFGDAIVLGPGQMTQAHKSDEYVEIAEINKYSLLFKKLIEGS